MFRHLRTLAIVALCTLCLLPPAPAAAATADEARALVSQLVAEGLKTFAGTTMTKDVRNRTLNAFTQKYASPPLTAAAVVGRYWAKATPDEQARFVDLLFAYAITAWEDQLSDVAPGQKVEIQDTEQTADGMVVHTLATDDQDQSRIDWLVVTAPDGRAVVLDVAADGVSIVQTMKADFTSILRANGGKLDALMDAMRQKMAQPH